MTDRQSDRAPSYKEKKSEDENSEEEGEEELTEQLSWKGKRFSAQWAWLTYKTHINKEELEDFFYGLSKIKIIFWRAAHESSDKITPYDHTHVAVRWEKVINKTGCRWPDFGGIHPWIGVPKNKIHWEHILGYLAKQDPANKDLKPKINIITRILSCKDDKEALKKFAKRDIKCAQAILAIRAGVMKESDIPELEIMILHRWQKTFIEFTETYIEPVKDEESSDGFHDTPFEFPTKNGRHMGTIYDPKGRAGKTMLAKYLMYKNPKKYFVLNTIQGMYHVATQFENALKAGWSGDTVIICLTRSAADHKIYDPIECMCDGMMSTTKGLYSKTMLWDAKHIWLFVNWMPKLSALSEDRWNIWKINPITKNLEYVDFTEAKKIYKIESEKREKDSIKSFMDIKSGLRTPPGDWNIETEGEN